MGSTTQVATPFKDGGAVVAVCVFRAQLDAAATPFAGFLNTLALDLVIEVNIIFVLDVPVPEVVIEVGTRHVCHL